MLTRSSSLAALCLVASFSGAFGQSFNWQKSLPVTYEAPGIVPFGGTETRALVFMDGSLYAGIGDLGDPLLNDPATPGPQVARLDSPSGKWVEDPTFEAITRTPTGAKKYKAVTVIGSVHFDRDMNKAPITPVNVLLAGFWNNFNPTMDVGQKTGNGAYGAGTWQVVPLAKAYAGQVRSFLGYTDSVTGVELAFAGGYAIFSGAYDSGTHNILWNKGPEAGTVGLAVTGHDRVMNLAQCDGALYATEYTTVTKRIDGQNPHWDVIYKVEPTEAYIYTAGSGFRGISCVPNTHGAGNMLIAFWEAGGGAAPPQSQVQAYDIPTTQDTFKPQVEIDFGRSGIAAYNNTIPYGANILIGTQMYFSQSRTVATILDRTPGGAYTAIGVYGEGDLRAVRTVVASQFPGDPPGTIYAGGFDFDTRPAHNTDWVYRGTPNK
jgi:hypothetical protein